MRSEALAAGGDGILTVSPKGTENHSGSKGALSQDKGTFTCAGTRSHTTQHVLWPVP